MPVVYAVLNPKGGVGKSTTAGVLSYIGAKLEGKRILLLDFDPNRSQTNNWGTLDHIPKEERKKLNTVCNLFGNNQKLASETVIQTANGYDLAPGSGQLTIEQNWFMTESGADYHFVDLFEDDPYFSQYDYIIFDLAGAASKMTWAILMATNKVIVPLDPSKLAVDLVVDDIPTLIDGINRLKKRSGLPLTVLHKIVMVKVNQFKATTQSMDLLLTSSEGRISNDTFCFSCVSRSTEVETALNKGKHIIESSPNHKITQQYLAVYDEVFNDFSYEQLQQKYPALFE